tara:strand:- start:207 stop:515 length:309 start_codon:yes stop_codon:yes gene_type:complete
MALEMKIPQQGGVSHSKGYVRVTEVRFGSTDGGGTYAVVDLACYSSKTERDKGMDSQRIPSPSLDRRKYALPVSISGDPIAWAYGQLKADSSMTDIGAMTDV